MGTPIAWVLNLDADLELGAPAGYTPSKRVRLAMKPHVAQLAASLLAPDDLLVDADSPRLAAPGLAGRAFCPTPRALAILRRAGAVPEAHPSLEVLRRVNGRAFCSSLGATLPGASFVTDEEFALQILESEPEVGRGWRVKHAFGMAGRNQRVVLPDAARPGDLVFLRAGLARGGVQIEPDVPVEHEYAVHGLLGRDGTCRLGALVRQRCDARGAWVATEVIDETSEALSVLSGRMAEEGRAVARALGEVGYFGPFGIDAYTYRDRKGTLRLQPRSEINARYSMGFAVGFPREPRR